MARRDITPPIATRKPKFRAWLLIRVIGLMADMGFSAERAARFGNWCLSHMYVRYRVGKQRWEKICLAEYGTIEPTAPEEE